MHWLAPSEKDTANDALEKRLWAAADQFRINSGHSAVAQVTDQNKGELRVRLDEHRAPLLAIKRGEQPWPDVNAWRLRLHKEFDEAFASTQLPEGPDYAWVNEFLLKA